MRAPDFDALLRKGADGLAIQRFDGIVVPSPIINTLGAPVSFQPDSGFAFLVPVAMLIDPSGVAVEILDFSVTTTFNDASTATIAPLTDPAATGIADNMPRLRFQVSADTMPHAFEEFKTMLAADGESPVIKVSYRIKSSIALSAASISLRLYAYEVSL